MTAKKAPFLKLVSIFILLPLVALCLLLVSCQSRLIYFPRPYQSDEVGAFRKLPATQVIDYHTADGNQQAYLWSPSPKPQRLWIVCGGNGTVALDWLKWVRQYAPREDAWLLFDMPGYGGSSGTPRPGSIRRSLKAVVPATEQALGWQPGESRGRLRFFGHSLGAAVCLMAAQEYDIHRGVLMTPFTTSMDMAQVMIHLPLGFLVWHRFDNEARIREISKEPDAEIIIFHGDQDESIPAAMSRKMAAEFPQTIRYHEVPGGHHNTLQEMVPEQIARALREAR
jgi:pimeloyl-ACP methyl ester carboxylesterase